MAPTPTVYKIKSILLIYTSFLCVWNRPTKSQYSIQITLIMLHICEACRSLLLSPFSECAHWRLKVSASHCMCGCWTLDQDWLPNNLWCHKSCFAGPPLKIWSSVIVGNSKKSPHESTYTVKLNHSIGGTRRKTYFSTGLLISVFNFAKTNNAL